MEGEESRLEERFERSLPIGEKSEFRGSVDITGDLSQLLINQQNNGYLIRKPLNEVSDKPKMYIPPYYRKSVTNIRMKNPYRNQLNSLSEEDYEFFITSGVTEENAHVGKNGGISIRPIERGEKVTLKQLKASIGMLRKIPRIRDNNLGIVKVNSLQNYNGNSKFNI